MPHVNVKCKHNKRICYCIDCKGTQICIHNKRKSYCINCNGSEMCIHNKRKIHCIACGGSALCKTHLCEKYASNPKYKGYCLVCFVPLFPDEPNVRYY